MAKQSSLSKISLLEIKAEIRRREGAFGKLQKKRAKLLEKLAAIDAQITEAGGSITGGARGARARNEKGLVPYLLDVLDGKTMSVTEAADAVIKAGYVTTSPSFRTIVNQALLSHKSKFKKVSRGQYTAA